MAISTAKIPLIKVLAYGGAGTSAAVTSTAVPSVLLTQCKTRGQQLGLQAANQYHYLATYLTESYKLLKQKDKKKGYASSYCGQSPEKKGTCYPLIVKVTNNGTSTLEPYNIDSPQTNYVKATLEEANQWAEQILKNINAAKAKGIVTVAPAAAAA